MLAARIALALVLDPTALAHRAPTCAHNQKRPIRLRHLQCAQNAKCHKSVRQSIAIGRREQIRQQLCGNVKNADSKPRQNEKRKKNI